MKENFNLFLNLRAGFNLHKAGKGIYLKPLPWSVLFFASRTKTAMFLSSTTIVMMKLICLLSGLEVMEISLFIWFNGVAKTTSQTLFKKH